MSSNVGKENMVKYFHRKTCVFESLLLCAYAKESIFRSGAIKTLLPSTTSSIQQVVILFIMDSVFA